MIIWVPAVIANVGLVALLLGTKLVPTYCFGRLL
jgi:xanthosine utilization system XapX-like protein